MEPFSPKASSAPVVPFSDNDGVGKLFEKELATDDEGAKKSLKVPSTIFDGLKEEEAAVIAECGSFDDVFEEHFLEHLDDPGVYLIVWAAQLNFWTPHAWPALLLLLITTVVQVGIPFALLYTAYEGVYMSFDNVCPGPSSRTEDPVVDDEGFQVHGKLIGELVLNGQRSPGTEFLVDGGQALDDSRDDDRTVRHKYDRSFEESYNEESHVILVERITAFFLALYLFASLLDTLLEVKIWLILAHATHSPWNILLDIGAFARLSAMFLTIICTQVLFIDSPEVRDLLLNCAALGFVAEVDNTMATFFKPYFSCFPTLRDIRARCDRVLGHIKSNWDRSEVGASHQSSPLAWPHVTNSALLLQLFSMLNRSGKKFARRTPATISGNCIATIRSLHFSTTFCLYCSLCSVWLRALQRRSASTTTRSFPTYRPLPCTAVTRKKMVEENRGLSLTHTRAHTLSLSHTHNVLEHGLGW